MDTLKSNILHVKVTNPLTQTNERMKNPEMYKHREKHKKNQYNTRIIQIEKGSFTSLIFSYTGGAGPEAEKIKSRRGENNSHTISFLPQET